MTKENEVELIATLREIRNVLTLAALTSNPKTAQVAQKLLMEFAESWLGVKSK
jgi:hypothetical protein